MTTPVFQSAVYTIAPAFDGWHIRQSEADEHPMIPEQILLHEPLRPDPFRKIKTAANGRNPARYAWWVLWNRSPLPNVYHAYEPQGDALYLLLFYQPKPGFTKPFRLLVAEVTDSFPKSPELWQIVLETLADLPPVAPVPVIRVA